MAISSTTMRRLLPLLLFVPFLLPTAVLAGDFDDCTDTPECTCEPVDPYPSDGSTMESIDDCQEYCTTIATFDSSVTGYTIQCTVGGVTTVLSQGDNETLDEATAELSGVSDPTLGVEIPGLEFTPAYQDGEAVVSNYLGEYIEAVYNWLIPVGGLLAVVIIMIAGLQWMVARGNTSRIGKAKDRIRNAVTGIILLLGAATLANIMNPQLLTYDSLKIRAIKSEFVSTEDTFSDVSDPNLNLSDPPVTESDVAIIGTNGVTYFTQRGNDTNYSCGTTVETSGCGPTSAAMVYHTLGVEEATPSYVAQYFLAEGFRACDSSCNCNGTYYGAFTDSSIAKDNGIRGEQFSIDDTNGIYNALEEGEMFIVSVGPSIFTSSGHFIVLTGVTEDGQISINDPNSGITAASVTDVFEPLKFAVRMYKE